MTLIEEVSKYVRERQSGLTDDERMELWSEIMSGYCKECGCDDPQCQCWNDE